MVRVRIPMPLRAFAEGSEEVELPGATVGEALEALVRRFPPMRRHLYADGGRLRGFVNVFVNADDVRDREGERTPVLEGDTIVIVPSIAGGAEPLPELTRPELARYARHLVLEEVGMEGQRRLKAARVLIVGAGGLGSPAALYLAAAGVGTIGLVDFDEVDASNLQRQILFGVSDIGRPKTEAAARRLDDLNPNVRVVRHDLRLTRDNALGVFRDYDVVVDGTDNFPTRYLANDACVLLGKPYVYGSILRFEGQVSVFWGKKGPCYRCLFREPPPPGLVPSCAEGGVLGVLPGIIGSLQALEAIKLIVGTGDTLLGRLVLFDALSFHFRELTLRKHAECPICGEAPAITELIDYEDFCGLRAEAEELQEATPDEAAAPSDGCAVELPAGLSAGELKERLDRGETIELIDIREPFEWRIASLEPYGARLVPMAELAERLDDLDRDTPIVLYCHSGRRSMVARHQLAAAGFRSVAYLVGGIAAWGDEVDPSLQRY